MNIKHIFTITASFALILISATPNYAQSANLKKTDPFQKNEVNPLYGTGGLNPMDLIHNANFLNGRSDAEFYQDSNDNLDSAADKFKKEQLLRMQQNEQKLESNSTDIDQVE